MRLLSTALLLLAACTVPEPAADPARRFLYVASSGVLNEVEWGGKGIPVYDIDRGHTFVRRIPSPFAKYSIRLEKIVGALATFEFRCEQDQGTIDGQTELSPVFSDAAVDLRRDLSEVGVVNWTVFVSFLFGLKNSRWTFVPTGPAIMRKHCLGLLPSTLTPLIFLSTNPASRPAAFE